MHHHVRIEVRPAWAFRLPGGTMDGLVRRRGAVLERLLHVEDEPVVVRAAQPAAEQVVLGAWSAERDAAEEGLRRWRRALGVDEDLRPFHDRFRHDRLIGPSVRAQPWLRPQRRADPFEALAWAVCEQLIEYERAVAIERRIVRRWGRSAAGPDGTVLRDAPGAAVVSGRCAPELEACDLAHRRAVALVAVAKEVATGRVDLHTTEPAEQEAGWRRLRRIPTIGAWTLEVLALQGQGRLDVLPAGDLAYRKLVARIQTGGNPHARVEEDEVRAFFAPYRGWAGLAGTHMLRAQAFPGVSAALPGPQPGAARAAPRGGLPSGGRPRARAARARP